MSRTLTRDLTEGRPLKLIVSFALPLLFGVLFQQLYSFVDTAIVGRFLGAERLAASRRSSRPSQFRRSASASSAIVARRFSSTM
jgi:Na+-driven multidrug efflux pump